jgi:hypothetical protein
MSEPSREIRPSPALPKDESLFIIFPLPGNNAIEIRLKSKVTQAEFHTIKKIFDLSELAFVKEEKE